MAALDWSQCSVAESVPGKVSGAWVLKGTRMPVSAIFGSLRREPISMTSWSGMTASIANRVRAVIEFAAHSLDRAPALALYARLEEIQPGSAESKLISGRIVDAIG